MNDRPAPPVLRPLAAFALIALCLSLSPGCQCSWKPDVGPVEDQESSAASGARSGARIENMHAEKPPVERAGGQEVPRFAST